MRNLAELALRSREFSDRRRFGTTMPHQFSDGNLKLRFEAVQRPGQAHRACCSEIHAGGFYNSSVILAENRSPARARPCGCNMRRAQCTGDRPMKSETLALLALGCLVLLAALCLAWELAIAPLRPGGSWLALKALPLALPMAGVMQRRRYTFQWASMLVLAYFAEGIVRAMTDAGLSQVMAVSELVLSLAFFVLAVAYVRSTAHNAGA
jgi:uncharacterized membrane protein